MEPLLIIEDKVVRLLGGPELIVLRADAADRHVIPPQAPTLKKYGINLRTWLETLERQGWVCSICGKASGTGAYVTDHKHVRGWKKLPDSERARTVRGTLCNYCNHRILRALTLDQARSCTKYLENYEMSLEDSLAADESST